MFFTACVLILLISLPLIMGMIKIDLTNQTEECMTWVQNHLFYNTQLHMERVDIRVQFENFSQLTEINCTNLVFVANELLLNAERKILIEDNINLNEILNMVLYRYSSETQKIEITNILGFNQFENHRKRTSFELKNTEIFFKNVNFDFYLNKTRISKEMCRHENFFSKQIEYFWPMTTVYFSFDVTYSTTVCPYAFLNSYLHHLGLFEITNSLIYKNP